MKPDFADLPDDQMLRVDRICSQFEAALQRRHGSTVEDILSEVLTSDRPFVLRELIPLELDYRKKNGRAVELKEYIARFPEVDRDWLAGLFLPVDQLRPDHNGILNRSENRTAVGSSSGRQSPLRNESGLRQMGDYRLLHQIGRGGMGTVYKAIHERMGRTVALKVLRPELQNDPLLMQRFDREVRTSAGLNHPNIVTAYDAREYQGVRFLITEFVDGVDLESLVRQQGPQPVSAAVDMVMQVARGLHYAHGQGIIHRDIKPANLLRDHSGTVRILDMGLARLESVDQSSETDQSGAELTSSGMIMGTAAYMAPEQARNTRRADARSDIYSLGCTLYFLLQGHSPFQGESAIDVLLAHATHPIPSLMNSRSDVSSKLDQLFRSMVAREPEARFQSAEELLIALEAVQQRSESERRLPSRRLWLSSAAGIAGIVVMLLLFLWPKSSSVSEVSLDSANHSEVVPNAESQKSDDNPVQNAAGQDAAHQSVPGRPNDSHGHGLRFNGHSSYAVVRELLPEPGATYTLEAVVRPHSFRTSNVISWLGPDWMAVYISEQGHWGLARRFGSESVVLAATEAAEPGKRVHVAGVFRGKQLQLFLDGRAAETASVDFTLSETRGGLHIGGVPRELLPPDQNDRYFHGEINAVRISADSRYSSPFDALYRFEVDDSTIILLPFDDGQGNQATAFGMNQGNATIMDAEWIRSGD